MSSLDQINRATIAFIKEYFSEPLDYYLGGPVEELEIGTYVISKHRKTYDQSGEVVGFDDTHNVRPYRLIKVKFDVGEIKTFHSGWLEPIDDQFGEWVRRVREAATPPKERMLVGGNTKAKNEEE